MIGPAGFMAAPKLDMRDELYEKAVQYVRATGKTRISALQRQFRAGYNRAARMIENMERDGIVSAPDYRGERQLLRPNDRSDE